MSSQDSASVAVREKILGTWRMLAWKRILVVTGAVSDALGPLPFGYLNYAPDGRLIYTTYETIDPIDGQLCRYRVEFERA